jgi:hypothetical protein
MVRHHLLRKSFLLQQGHPPQPSSLKAEKTKAWFRTEVPVIRLAIYWRKQTHNLARVVIES